MGTWDYDLFQDDDPEREEARLATREAARRHGLDPDLLEAMAYQESRFSRKAVSPVGARGHAQFMPGTARRFGYQPGDMHDPYKAADAQARYVRSLLEHFGGDVEKAIAGYNWGENRQRLIRARSLSDIEREMPRETRGYVRDVKKYWNDLHQRRRVEGWRSRFEDDKARDPFADPSVRRFAATGDTEPDGADRSPILPGGASSSIAKPFGYYDKNRPAPADVAPPPELQGVYGTPGTLVEEPEPTSESPAVTPEGTPAVPRKGRGSAQEPRPTRGAADFRAADALIDGLLQVGGHLQEAASRFGIGPEPTVDRAGRVRRDAAGRQKVYYGAGLPTPALEDVRRRGAYDAIVDEGTRPARFAPKGRVAKPDPRAARDPDSPLMQVRDDPRYGPTSEPLADQASTAYSDAAAARDAYHRRKQEGRERYRNPPSGFFQGTDEATRARLGEPAPSPVPVLGRVGDALVKFPGEFQKAYADVSRPGSGIPADEATPIFYALDRARVNSMNRATEAYLQHEERTTGRSREQSHPYLLGTNLGRGAVNLQQAVIDPFRTGTTGGFLEPDFERGQAWAPAVGELAGDLVPTVGAFKLAGMPIQGALRRAAPRLGQRLAGGIGTATTSAIASGGMSLARMPRPGQTSDMRIREALSATAAGAVGGALAPFGKTLLGRIGWQGVGGTVANEAIDNALGVPRDRAPHITGDAAWDMRIVDFAMNAAFALNRFGRVRVEDTAGRAGTIDLDGTFESLHGRPLRDAASRLPLAGDPLAYRIDEPTFELLFGVHRNTDAGHAARRLARDNFRHSAATLTDDTRFRQGLRDQGVELAGEQRPQTRPEEVASIVVQRDNATRLAAEALERAQEARLTSDSSAYVAQLQAEAQFHRTRAQEFDRQLAVRAEEGRNVVTREPLTPAPEVVDVRPDAGILGTDEQGNIGIRDERGNLRVIPGGPPRRPTPERAPEGAAPRQGRAREFTVTDDRGRMGVVQVGTRGEPRFQAVTNERSRARRDPAEAIRVESSDFEALFGTPDPETGAPYGFAPEEVAAVRARFVAEHAVAPAPPARPVPAPAPAPASPAPRVEAPPPAPRLEAPAPETAETPAPARDEIGLGTTVEFTGVGGTPERGHITEYGATDFVVETATGPVRVDHGRVRRVEAPPAAPPPADPRRAPGLVEAVAVDGTVARLKVEGVTGALEAGHLAGLGFRRIGDGTYVFDVDPSEAGQRRAAHTRTAAEAVMRGEDPETAIARARAERLRPPPEPTPEPTPDDPDPVRTSRRSDVELADASPLRDEETATDVRGRQIPGAVLYERARAAAQRGQAMRPEGLQKALLVSYDVAERLMERLYRDGVLGQGRVGGSHQRRFYVADRKTGERLTKPLDERGANEALRQHRDHGEDVVVVRTRESDFHQMVHSDAAALNVARAPRVLREGDRTTARVLLVDVDLGDVIGKITGHMSSEKIVDFEGILLNSPQAVRLGRFLDEMRAHPGLTAAGRQRVDELAAHLRAAPEGEALAVVIDRNVFGQPLARADVDRIARHEALHYGQEMAVADDPHPQAARLDRERRAFHVLSAEAADRLREKWPGVYDYLDRLGYFRNYARTEGQRVAYFAMESLAHVVQFDFAAMRPADRARILTDLGFRSADEAIEFYFDYITEMVAEHGAQAVEKLGEVSDTFVPVYEKAVRLGTTGYWDRIWREGHGQDFVGAGTEVAGAASSARGGTDAGGGRVPPGDASSARSRRAGPKPGLARRVGAVIARRRNQNAGLSPEERARNFSAFLRNAATLTPDGAPVVYHTVAAESFHGPEPVGIRLVASPERASDLLGIYPAVDRVYVRTTDPYDPDSARSRERLIHALEPGVVTALGDALRTGERAALEDVRVQKALFDAGFDAYYATADGGRDLYVYDAGQLAPTYDGELRRASVRLSQLPLRAVSGPEREANRARWARRSRVRNEDGTLKVVYHGTGQSHVIEHRFEWGKLAPTNLYGPGFYFTEDPEIAGGRGLVPSLEEEGRFSYATHSRARAEAMEWGDMAARRGLRLEHEIVDHGEAGGDRQFELVVKLYDDTKLQRDLNGYTNKGARPLPLDLAERERVRDAILASDAFRATEAAYERWEAISAEPGFTSFIPHVAKKYFEGNAEEARRVRDLWQANQDARNAAGMLAQSGDPQHLFRVTPSEPLNKVLEDLADELRAAGAFERMGGGVFPVHLRIENPLDIDAPVTFDQAARLAEAAWRSKILSSKAAERLARELEALDKRYVASDTLRARIHSYFLPDPKEADLSGFLMRTSYVEREVANALLGSYSRERAPSRLDAEGLRRVLGEIRNPPRHMADVLGKIPARKRHAVAERLEAEYAETLDVARADTDTGWTGDELWEALKEAIPYRGGGQGVNPKTGQGWRSNEEVLNLFLEEAGYDGITHVGGRGDKKRHRVWIAFDGSQIKGVHNRGTFDDSDFFMRSARDDVRERLDPLPPEERARNRERWGARSAVKDEHGQLKRLFHGTGQVGVDFDRIDFSVLDPFALFGPGFYMTEDPEVAGGRGLIPEERVLAEQSFETQAEAEAFAQTRAFGERKKNPRLRYEWDVEDESRGGPPWFVATVTSYDDSKIRPDDAEGYSLKGQGPLPLPVEDIRMYAERFRSNPEYRRLQKLRERYRQAGFTHATSPWDEAGIEAFGDQETFMDAMDADRILTITDLSIAEAERTNIPSTLMFTVGHGPIDEIGYGIRRDLEERGALGKGGGRVYPFHTNIERPYDMDEPVTLGAVRRLLDAAAASKAFHRMAKDRALRILSEYTRFTVMKSGDEQIDKTGEALWGEIGQALATEIDSGTNPKTGKRWQSPKEMANVLLEEAGFDGITHTGGRRVGNKQHRVWIAFRPDQVKSQFNRGTYDDSEFFMRSAREIDETARELSEPVDEPESEFFVRSVPRQDDYGRLIRSHRDRDLGEMMIKVGEQWVTETEAWADAIRSWQLTPAESSLGMRTPVLRTNYLGFSLLEGLLRRDDRFTDAESEGFNLNTLAASLIKEGLRERIEDGTMPVYDTYYAEFLKRLGPFVKPGLSIVKTEVLPGLATSRERVAENVLHEGQHGGQIVAVERSDNALVRVQNRVGAPRHQDLFHPSVAAKMPSRKKLQETIGVDYGLDPKRDVQTLVIEAAAFIGSMKDPTQLGLTARQAATFMSWYFDRVVEHHGQEALAGLDSLTDRMRAVHREALERSDDRARRTTTGEGGGTEGPGGGSEGGTPRSLRRDDADARRRLLEGWGGGDGGRVPEDASGDADTISLRSVAAPPADIEPYVNRKYVGNLTPEGWTVFDRTLERTVVDLRGRGEDPRRRVPMSEIQDEARRLAATLVQDLVAPDDRRLRQMAAERAAAKIARKALVREQVKLEAELGQLIGGKATLTPAEYLRGEELAQKIASFEHDVTQLQNYLTPLRSWDGRNLAYNKMMVDETGFDPDRWTQIAAQKAKTAMTTGEFADVEREIRKATGRGMIAVDTVDRLRRELAGARTRAEREDILKKIHIWERTRDAAALDLAKLMRRVHQSRLLEWYRAARISGMFSGLVNTVGRNLGGGAFRQVENEMEMLPKALLDIMIAWGRYLRTGEYQRSEAPGIPFLNRGVGRALVRGVPRGLVEWWRTVRHGPQPKLMNMRYGVREEVHFSWENVGAVRRLARGLSAIAGRRIELGRGPVLGPTARAMNLMVNGVFRVVAGADAPLRHAAFERALYSYARAYAITEKHAGRLQTSVGDLVDRILADPEAYPELFAEASYRADVLSFNNRNPLSDFIAGGRRSTGVGGNMLFDILLPVDRTPTNIFLHLIENYLGVGVVSKPMKAHIRRTIDRRMSPAAQRLFAEAVSGPMTGVTLMLLGYKLAEWGLMTGIATEPEERDMMEEFGQHEGAVKFMGEWRQLTGFAPTPNAMIIGASFFKASLARDPLTAHARRVAIGTTTAMQMPLAQGIRDVGGVVNPQSLDSGAVRLGRIASTFAMPGISSAMSEVARATDRDPESGEVRSRRPVEFLDPIRERIPFVREQVPERHTTLGRRPQVSRIHFMDPFRSRADRRDTDPFLRDLSEADYRVQRTTKDREEPAEEFVARRLETSREIDRSMRERHASPLYRTLPPASDPAGARLRADELKEAESEGRRTVNVVNDSRRLRRVERERRDFDASAYRADPAVERQTAETENQALVAEAVGHFRRDPRYERLREHSPEIATQAAADFERRLRSLLVVPDDYRDERTLDRKLARRAKETEALRARRERYLQSDYLQRLTDASLERALRLQAQTGP